MTSRHSTHAPAARQIAALDILAAKRIVRRKWPANRRREFRDAGNELERLARLIGSEPWLRSDGILPYEGIVDSPHACQSLIARSYPPCAGVLQALALRETTQRRP